MLDKKEHNHTTETVFERLSNLKIYPPETLTPYEEFRVGSKTYYFTPGGSLYRRETRDGRDWWRLLRLPH